MDIKTPLMLNQGDIILILTQIRAMQYDYPYPISVPAGCKALVLADYYSPTSELALLVVLNPELPATAFYITGGDGLIYGQHYRFLERKDAIVVLGPPRFDYSKGMSYLCHGRNLLPPLHWSEQIERANGFYQVKTDKEVAL